ncbi:MAG: sulfatase-like hydrolase/transferase [Opitutaceae bacterium]
MRTRPWLAAVLAVVAFIFLLPVGVSAADGADNGRMMNVLLIISDDMRTELATYGSALAQTPNLDRLAREGVRFDRAYCQYPLCNPSRTSMLTGRHPTTTNVYGNREYFGATHPDWVSLPKYFKQRGYVTLRSGKIFHGGIDDTEAWTEGGERRRFGNQPSAGKPWAPAAKPVTPEEEAGRMARMLQADLRQAPHSDRGQPLEGPEEEDGDYRTTNRAIGFLRKYQDSEQPFFLAHGVSRPHSPLIAPQRFFDLYNIDDIKLPPDFAPRPTVPDGFPAGSIRMSTADLFIGREATPEQAREMIRAYLACVSHADWNIGRVLANWTHSACARAPSSSSGATMAINWERRANGQRRGRCGSRARGCR